MLAKIPHTVKIVPTTNMFHINISLFLIWNNKQNQIGSYQLNI